MHEIQDVDKIVDFIRAGNATFTIKSARTDKHYTYRVTSKPDKPMFVRVKTGDTDLFVGSIFSGYKFRTQTGGPAALAFDYFWRWMIERNQVPQSITFYHEGKCGRCGRPLTDPVSIERGLGPDCAEM